MSDYENFELIEISGGGCAGCESLMPSARAAAEKFGVKFSRIDYSALGKLLKEWQIERVPALVLLKRGTPVATCYGYQPEEILTIYIESKLEEYSREEKTYAK